MKCKIKTVSWLFLRITRVNSLISPKFQSRDGLKGGILSRASGGREDEVHIRSLECKRQLFFMLVTILNIQFY